MYMQVKMDTNDDGPNRSDLRIDMDLYQMKFWPVPPCPALPPNLVKFDGQTVSEKAPILKIHVWTKAVPFKIDTGGPKILNIYEPRSPDQLSSQHHYDHGMRTVKFVLASAGKLKLKCQSENDAVLEMKAIKDANMSKFLARDILFEGIISDLFPDIVLRPYLDTLVDPQKVVCEKQNLQPTNFLIEKTLQTYELILVRNGLMVVGEAVGGKTSSYQMTNTDPKNQNYFIKICYNNSRPNSILQMTPQTKMMFDPARKKQPSALTVSWRGIIYIEPRQLGWRPIKNSYLDRLPKGFSREQKELLDALFEWMVDPVIQDCESDDAAPQSSIWFQHCFVFDGIWSDKDKFTSIMINASANQTQDITMAKLERRKKGLYEPYVGKICVISVDDLSIPQEKDFITENKWFCSDRKLYGGAKSKSSAPNVHFTPSNEALETGILGIDNLGHTCYLNVIVQWLLQSEPLCKYIKDIVVISPDDIRDDKYQLTRELKCIVEQANSGLLKIISMRDFLKVFQNIHPVFVINISHDAQDCLQAILQTLNDEFTDWNSSNPQAVDNSNTLVTVPEDSTDDTIPAKKIKLDPEVENHWENHLKGNSQLITTTFHGVYKIVTTCNKCLAETSTLETMKDMQLPILFKRNPGTPLIPAPAVKDTKDVAKSSIQKTPFSNPVVDVTLAECIDNFMNKDNLTSKYCKSCKDTCSAKINRSFGRTPTTLIVALNRTEEDQGKVKKLGLAVEFPLVGLDLEPFVDQTLKNAANMYDLTCCVCHNGLEADDGHFTCFKRNQKSDKWYLCNDAIVTCEEPRNIQMMTGYLLFYEKRIV